MYIIFILQVFILGNWDMNTLIITIIITSILLLSCMQLVFHDYDTVFIGPIIVSIQWQLMCDLRINRLFEPILCNSKRLRL